MEIIESIYHSEVTERKISEENAIVVKGLRKALAFAWCIGIIVVSMPVATWLFKRQTLR
jgi:hypothetical protein